MKKLLLIVGICSLLVGMPVTAAISTPIMSHAESKMNTIEKEMSLVERTNPTVTTEAPPDWANGNFSGVWGIDIWGETHIPIGWLYGYYKRNMRIGFFAGVFATFEEENFSHYLAGFFFGPFMFGKVGEIVGENETGNKTVFVGLGGYNETHFYWRIMGIKGPTFFMYGIYSKFNN